MSYDQRKTPPRSDCEKTIRRILVTEVLENGKNKHFKNAMDFLPFFQSLYPSSDALVKQVQRAVKALNMPKDEDGFFIIDRTNEQVEQDNLISTILKKGSANVCDISECTPVYVKIQKEYIDIIISLMEESTTFSGKYETIVKTNDGIIIYTKEEKRLNIQLSRLLL